MGKIQGYLPKGYALNPHAVRLIADDGVGGEYSYDKKKEVWAVRFPDEPFCLRVAAQLYSKVYHDGYVIPTNDELKKRILEYFNVRHIGDLPADIRNSSF